MSTVVREVIPIDEGWIFKRRDDSESDWRSVAQFPTNIHLDLMHHGVIPDPFIGKNEDVVQWVGDTPWVYRTRFASPAIVHRRAVLAFDGLDTYACVILNGENILDTENMFIPERVDVTKHIRTNAENVIDIVFETTYLNGKRLVEKYPKHRWGCWNGDPSRLAVRKAQYHYGWDWGPKLLTCGPWRPISLEIYTVRISELWFSTTIDESLKSAEVVAKAQVEGEASDIEFEILFDGKSVGIENVNVDNGFATATFKSENPKLWYPAGYGDQPLYVLKASLWSGGTKLDSVSKRFGLRKVRVVQRELEEAPGTTFLIEINNIPIFCGGSCWNPAQSFIPRLNPQNYLECVKLAVESNQVMIRVWGGGIWEEQAFYDACDELGVLVWQDFLFACGNYPAHEQFLHLVEREAIANVKSLRHHPSIVIYAGNNEDYQYQESENLDYNPSDKNPGNWLKSSFPARYIYEKLLVDITQDLVPDIYYHFGSPFGGNSTKDPTVGDIHQWNVWHGTQERYQDFDRLSGRFVSEFGMEAFPSIRTIDSYLPQGAKDPDRYPQSSTVDFHNKAAGHERRLTTYMSENLQFTFKPFEQYIYATQLLQAEAVGTAYRLFRRQWQGPGKEHCAGALVWQLTDCWPVTSWSVVDYYLRPKLAYFAIKRELKPITIGMKQTTRHLPADESYNGISKVIHEIEIWASNLSLEERKGSLIVNSYDIVTGKRKGCNVSPNRKFPPNRSTEFGTWPIPIRDEDEYYRTVTAAYIYDFDAEEQVASSVSWPEPLRCVPFQKPKQLHSDVLDGVLLIRSELPVKGVMLELEDDEDKVKWDDNGFDVLPGDPVVVKAHGLEKSDAAKLRIRYMGSEGECGA